VSQALTGVVFAAAVSLAALRAGAFRSSGAVAAWIVGACVFAAGGWPFAAVLLAFFLPAALLSRMGRARKRDLADIEKPGARDAMQVAANGGVAAFCALMAVNTHSHAMTAAFAGAFCAASADTWGTEIGTLFKGLPRSLLTMRPVAAGLSGGVTLPGTGAELAGAFVVALVAAALGVAPLWACAAGGVAGAFADSFLGATLQELRYCPRCARACETNPHHCGTPTVRRRGFPWMSNDVVNACATAVGALVAGALAAA